MIFTAINLTKKIKWRSAHIYFFYLFLFLMPFQARKVFLTQHSFYSGAFTEYTTFFIYISDILLILTFIFWLVFNKKIYECFNIKNIKNIGKLPIAWLFLLIFIIWLIINTIINNDYAEISVFQIFKFIELSLLIIYIYFNFKGKNKLTTALFTLSFAGFLQGIIAIYQFISQGPLFKHPFLHKLTGESTVYPQLPGIAKVVIDNEKLVRAYGIFPHPNVLGGFLVLTTIITIYLFLKHKKDVLSSIKARLNTFYNTNNIKSQEYIASLFWIIFIFIQITALFFTFSRTAWVGFLLSLFIISVFYFYNIFKLQNTVLLSSRTEPQRRERSKNAANEDNFAFGSLSRYHSFGMTKKRSFHSVIQNNFKIVSRETINLFHKKTTYQYIVLRMRYLFKNIKKTISRQKELFIIFLLAMILITSYFPLFKSRLGDNLINESSYLLNNSAISDRNFYNNVSRETISDNFIFGSGLGTFIFQIDDFARNKEINQTIQPWKYQPAHNIYFLIASEIGTVGLLLFLLFIFNIISYGFKNIKTILDNNLIVSRETIYSTKLNYFLLAIIISFLFIGLFDHYFWTLQQGRLIFWLILGLILVGYKDK